MNADDMLDILMLQGAVQILQRDDRNQNAIERLTEVIKEIKGEEK